MTDRIDALRDLIVAARATGRRVQDETLAERKRDADVSALQAEAVRERRNRTGY